MEILKRVNWSIFKLDSESCRAFSVNLDIKTQILLAYYVIVYN
jgi:hypothetical protein